MQEAGKFWLEWLLSCVLQAPLRNRTEQHLGRARLPVAVGILARAVNVESVMGVLDYGYSEPAGAKQRDQVLDQRRFAVTGIRGEAEDFQDGRDGKLMVILSCTRL